jgi:hypothetical protein
MAFESYQRQIYDTYALSGHDTADLAQIIMQFGKDYKDILYNPSELNIYQKVELLFNAPGSITTYLLLIRNRLENKLRITATNSEYLIPLIASIDRLLSQIISTVLSMKLPQTMQELDETQLLKNLLTFVFTSNDIKQDDWLKNIIKLVKDKCTNTPEDLATLATIIGQIDNTLDKKSKNFSTHSSPFIYFLYEIFQHFNFPREFVIPTKDSVGLSQQIFSFTKWENIFLNLDIKDYNTSFRQLFSTLKNLYILYRAELDETCKAYFNVDTFNFVMKNLEILYNNSNLQQLKDGIGQSSTYPYFQLFTQLRSNDFRMPIPLIDDCSSIYESDNKKIIYQAFTEVLEGLACSEQAEKVSASLSPGSKLLDIASSYEEYKPLETYIRYAGANGSDNEPEIISYHKEEEILAVKTDSNESKHEPTLPDLEDDWIQFDLEDEAELAPSPSAASGPNTFFASSKKPSSPAVPIPQQQPAQSSGSSSGGWFSAFTNSNSSTLSQAIPVPQQQSASVSGSSGGWFSTFSSSFGFGRSS